MFDKTLRLNDSIFYHHLQVWRCS